MYRRGASSLFVLMNWAMREPRHVERATSTVSTSFLYMDVSKIIKNIRMLNRREIEEAEINVMGNSSGVKQRDKDKTQIYSVLMIRACDVSNFTDFGVLKSYHGQKYAYVYCDENRAGLIYSNNEEDGNDVILFNDSEHKKEVHQVVHAAILMQKGDTIEDIRKIPGNENFPLKSICKDSVLLQNAYFDKIINKLKNKLNSKSDEKTKN